MGALYAIAGVVLCCGIGGSLLAILALLAPRQQQQAAAGEGRPSPRGEA